MKHGQWFLSFGKECFRRMCNRLGGKHALIFHEEVWFMSFSAFHNVILKWKLQTYEVDYTCILNILIFLFGIGEGVGYIKCSWFDGEGYFYCVKAVLLISCFQVMYFDYFENDHHLFFWILTEWYSYHAYRVWSFIWLCSDFLTRYCSEQKASLS